jgi:hypothetical protein
MSRSYAKKYRCLSTVTGQKRLANKRVRHTKNLLNGNTYKKTYDSYNINDGNRAKPIPADNPKLKRK